MKGLLLLLGVCVVVLAWQVEANSKNTKQFWDPWGTDDFDIDASGDDDGDKDNTHVDDEDENEITGSGDGKDEEETDDKISLPTDIDFGVDDKKKTTKLPTTDDEDLYDESGSGEFTTAKANLQYNLTTSRPLTACETLRNSAVNGAEWKPDCDEMGGFKQLQCTFDIVNKERYCWCVNPEGIEIQGTRLQHPKTPGCSFGENLSTCVFQLVQHSQGLLGAYRPKCTATGDYEPLQCHGSECWCVDKLGNDINGSFKNLPDRPDCDALDVTEVTEETIVVQTTKKPTYIKPPYNVIPGDKDDDKTEEDDVEVNIGSEIPVDKEEEEDEVNNTGDKDSMYAPTQHNTGGIMGQPGLLAAIIGGSVVLLLVVVLLVMFIVYRMRKKDEGSYPLDEQKYQNYSYQKAPDKEFYA